MKYLNLINRFWRLNKEHIFSPGEVHLFFKLLDTCNNLGWKSPFRQSNRFIMGETGMCERTIIGCRKRLKEAGLIDYHSTPEKREQVLYFIVGVEESDNTGGDQAETEKEPSKNSERNRRLKIDYSLPDIEYEDQVKPVPQVRAEKEMPVRQLPAIVNKEHKPGNSNVTKGREWKLPGKEQLELPVLNDSFKEDREEESHPDEEKNLPGQAGNCTLNVDQTPDKNQTNVAHKSDNCEIKVEQMTDKSSTNVQQMCDKNTDNIRLDLDTDKDKDAEEEEKKNDPEDAVSKEGKSSSLTALQRRQCHEILENYNRICKNLPRAVSLSEMRMSHMAARINDHSMEIVKKMLGAAGRSQFLAGNNDRGWKASIDWLFNPTNFLKVVEGNYEHLHKMKSNNISGGQQKPSPISALKRAYENIISNDDEFRQQ
ncbi:MAG TPA: hypothetical protein VK212_04490 [Lentimicrobium sp.]|nr:hypothetical protein [Lentimicrobium sp.]